MSRRKLFDNVGDRLGYSRIYCRLQLGTSESMPFPQTLRWLVGLCLVVCCKLHTAEKPKTNSFETPETTSPEAREVDSLTVSQRPKPVRLTEAYPRAHWRLAPPEALAQTILWVSHILIRHELVPSGVVSFGLPGWVAQPEPPARSRQKAFELARHIAQRLHSKPASFSRMAREYSEDVTTRNWGGDFGGVIAWKFVDCPDVLDGLASLAPGAISRVIETRYGFHIFLRQQPPPNIQLSGQRLVISYDSAPWLKEILPRGKTPTRSRDEALALAQELYLEATESPDSFTTLVDQHSELQGAEYGGDFGQWGSRQPTPFPRAVRSLRQVGVGNIAPPTDSAFGIQIVRRTPLRERVHFAIESIRFLFDPEASAPALDSRETSLRSAGAAIELLKAQPQSFAALQQKHCCTHFESWHEGQSHAARDALIARLAIGEVTSTPIAEQGLFRIIKRVAPRASSQAPVFLELPLPVLPEPKAFILWIRGPEILDRLLELALKYTDGSAAKVAELQLSYKQAQTDLQRSQSLRERAGHYEVLQQRINEQLTVTQQRMYHRAVQEYLAEWLMANR